MDEKEQDERGFFFERPHSPARGRRAPASGAADRPDAPAARRPVAGPEERPDHLGHRDRLRQRLRNGGAEALADYEILEALLFRSLPRRDTKPIAKALIKRFGSLGGVLNAPEARLKEVDGVKDATAIDLRIVAIAAQRSLRADLAGREILSSWSAVIGYCTAAMAHESREQFRILFLDKKNGLIADEVQTIGTVDHTPVYPREVVRRALELSATALILVHNHPTCHS